MNPSKLALVLRVRSDQVPTTFWSSFVTCKAVRSLLLKLDDLVASK